MIDFREIRFVFKISLNRSLDQDQYAGLVMSCTLIQNYLRLEYPKKSNFLIQVPILIKAKKNYFLQNILGDMDKWIGM